MIYLDLIQNIALLMAMVVLQQIIFEFKSFEKWLSWPIFRVGTSGLAYGVVAVIAMMASVNFTSGVIFDSRSIIMITAGLFGGPIVALISASIALSYRLWLGGGGAMVGSMVIAESAGLGLVWHCLREKYPWFVGKPGLYLLGALVHLLMIGLMAWLPKGVRSDFFRQVSVPVLVLYPLATMVVGRLFLRQEEINEKSKSLSESEERYRQLFNNKHTVLMIIDPTDGAIVDANPAAEGFYGWGRSQLCSMKIGEINTLGPEKVQEEMRNAAEEKRNYFKFQHRKADNSVCEVEVNSSPITIKGKNLLFSSIHDVTERNNLERQVKATNESLKQALKTSERARLALLNILEDEKEARLMLHEQGKVLNAAQRIGKVGSWIWKIPEKKLSWSDEMYHIWGLDPSVELSFELIESMIHPGDRPTNQANVAKLLEGQFLADHEFRIIRPDGKIVYVRQVAEPKIGAKGELTEALGIVQDITDYKIALEVIRESEGKYRRLHESMVDGFVQVDMEGQIVEFNEAYRQMLGYSENELKGLTYKQLTPEKWHGYEENIVRTQIMTMGVSGVYQKEYRRKDGCIIPVELRAYLIKDQDEKNEGMWAIVRDIAERKAAERAAEESLREKEVMLREIHHRVKNNLQVIASLLNLQSGYVQEKRYRQMFLESQHRVRSMAMVHEKIYKSENLARVNFPEYVDSLIQELFVSYGVSPSQGEWSTEIGFGKMPLDTAVPCGLIISELVSNSLKYALPACQQEGRRGIIRVKLKQVGEGRLSLEVCDNGPGMNKQYAGAEPQTLGLQLVEILAHQLDGRLDLRNDGGLCAKIEFVLQGE